MAISNKMKSGFRKIGDKFNKLTSFPSSSTEVAPSPSPSMDFSLVEDLDSGDETDYQEVGVVYCFARLFVISCPLPLPLPLPLPPPPLPHQPPELPVEEEEWYYGDIEREVGENKCKNNGDYIVRYSEGISQFTLTCKWNGAPKHFVILETTDVSIEFLIYELLVWPNEVEPWFITLTCVYTTANLGFMLASM